MSVRVAVDDFGEDLRKLVRQVALGDDVLLTIDERVVARLESASAAEPSIEPRRLGWAEGRVHIHSDDEEHLAGFAEYMP